MATTKATTLAHTLGGISSDISTAEINRLDGLTGDIQTQLNLKAPIASPTFTGTATFAAVAGTTGTFSGAVTGSNLNISNWDTAYGYGNHASAGYLTSVAFTNINSNVTITSSETFVSNDEKFNFHT